MLCLNWALIVHVETIRGVSLMLNLFSLVPEI